MYVNQLYALMR